MSSTPAKVVCSVSRSPTTRRLEPARRLIIPYHGRFVTLVPDQQVVEVMEFETTDPAMRGAMTVTFTLTDADGGTDVRAVHDNLPPGIAPADNETGWRMALDNLAALVEAG